MITNHFYPDQARRWMMPGDTEKDAGARGEGEDILLTWSGG